MKKCIFLTAFLLCCTVLPAQATSPTETLQQGIGRLMTVLRDPAYDLEAGLSDKHLEALCHVAYSFFDFNELTRRCVGRVWKTFSPKQRTDLATAFRELLEKTYIRKLNTDCLQELKGFTEDSIRFKSEQIQGSLAMVNTVFSLTDKELNVSFRLINKNGTWYAYDLIGEGLTLMGIYKDEFRNALLRQTPEELTASLQQRKLAVENKREAMGQD